MHPVIYGHIVDMRKAVVEIICSVWQDSVRKFLKNLLQNSKTFYNFTFTLYSVKRNRTIFILIYQYNLHYKQLV